MRRWRHRRSQRPHEVRDRRGRREKRKKSMRLINVTDLTFKSEALLKFMIHEYEALLYTMDASTYEYSIVRDSLEVIKRELAARRKRESNFLKPKF
jgi:hypothetical protein